jgi:hypothetical protein
MNIRDVNMNLLDMLEDICTETENIPNKNIDLQNHESSYSINSNFLSLLIWLIWYL